MSLLPLLLSLVLGLTAEARSLEPTAVEHGSRWAAGEEIVLAFLLCIRRTAERPALAFQWWDVRTERWTGITVLRYTDIPLLEQREAMCHCEYCEKSKIMFSFCRHLLQDTLDDALTLARHLYKYKHIEACEGKNIMICKGCTASLYGVTVSTTERGHDVWCFDTGSFTREIKV